MTAVAPPVPQIGPSLDAYGGRARASALADFLEVAALAGARITWAQLDSHAKNENWHRFTTQPIKAVAGRPAPDSWSEAVRGVIAQRADVLRADYPFQDTRGHVNYVPAGGHAPADDPYLALLALTVVHAWTLPCSVLPEAVLEEIAVRAVKHAGLQATPMGTLSGQNAGGGFPALLASAGKLLDLRPHPTPTPIAAAAKDEGVDTLAAVRWLDGRVGAWIFLGQATVGVSDTWEEKLRKARVDHWAGYLQESIRPRRFLVLAHHVEDDHWIDLVSDESGVVIDRLRLTTTKGPNSAREKSLIDDMRKCSVPKRL